MPWFGESETSTPPPHRGIPLADVTMESAEEDSYVELGTIIRSIRDADLHAHVHEKAAIFHRNAMEDAKVSAATAQQLSKTQRQLYRVRVGGP